jgi:uncharacterized SAM-binding protein YcdF (DUF218 family)
MLFVLKKVVAALLLPPASSLLLALVGWLAWRRSGRRCAIAFVWLGLGSLVVLSLPVVASALTWLVYDGSRFHPAAAARAQAIVVLGGGVRKASEFGGETLTRMGLERVRYGAWLARETGLPILVTGGRLSSNRTEGELMRAVLEREFATPVRWVEACAHNTHENARFSAWILKREGVSHVILVTHGVDARRGRREFSAAGLTVAVAPTYVPTSWGLSSAFDLIPSARALDQSALAIYEAFGNLALSLELNASGREPPPECQRH